MIVAYATTPDHKPEVSNNGENDPLHNRSMVAERDAGAMDSLAAHIRKFPRSGGVRGPAIGGRRNGPDRSQGGRRTMRRMFRVTAYCPCKICCGAHSDGVTASGRPVEYNGGRFVAADKAIAFGTMLSIPGYAGGRPVPVADRGGKIKGARLDVYFPTHAQAREFGDRENVLVEIQERTKDK
jgi:3D (Asp-Asp-Asp) domain-containing protein